MPIPVTCKCGKQFATNDENARRRARCPECGNDLIIPDVGGGVAAETVPEPTQAPATGPGMAAGVAPATSGMAIASLVLGLCSFLCLIFTGIPAIILGVLGLADITKGRGAIGGKGMAIAGIVLGGFFSTLGMISVLGILVGLLLPAVNSAREAGRRMQCQNNMRRISLAMVNYATSHDVYPPAGKVSPAGKPLLSWRVLVLPYLDEKALYNQFKLDEPWDSPHNKPLLASMPSVFRCPGRSETGPDLTYFRVLAGPGTLFEEPAGIAPAAITDGMSNTLLVVESNEPVSWTQPEGLAFTPQRPIEGLGGAHPGGFNAAFADGAVRFLPSSIAPSMLEALATRNGGEAVDLSEF